jgi:uncharacterized protein HemY
MTARRLPLVLELLSVPVLTAWAVLVLVPAFLIRGWWRHRTAAPAAAERWASRARGERARGERAFDDYEAATRAELLAHRLPDTPEHRAMVRGGARRRGR